MRIRLFMVMLLATLAAFAGEKMQRMNIKTGLWEVTRTINTQGQLPIPAGLLERMTPEQRARMEARLNAQQANSHTSTDRSCVTAKDLDDGGGFEKKPNAECTETIVKSTSTMAEVHIACEGEGMKGNGIVKVQALSPETVKGSTQITGSGGGHTMNSNSTFTAKWVSATCSK